MRYSVVCDRWHLQIEDWSGQELRDCCIMYALCTHGSVYAIGFHLHWPSRKQNLPYLTIHCTNVSAHQKGHQRFCQGLRPLWIFLEFGSCVWKTSPFTWSVTCKLNALFQRVLYWDSKWILIGLLGGAFFLEGLLHTWLIREDLSIVENHTIFDDWEVETQAGSVNFYQGHRVGLAHKVPFPSNMCNCRLCLAPSWTLRSF